MKNVKRPPQVLYDSAGPSSSNEQPGTSKPRSESGSSADEDWDSSSEDIYESIQEIETAIAFSKLQVLHQSILNTTELYKILKIVEQHAMTIYPVSLDNLIKIERTIVLKSFMNKNRLVFVLEVPLITTETYIYYKIIPIPVIKAQETHTIIPRFPYLLVNRSKYRPVMNPCEELEDNKFLCSDDNMPQYRNETCIEQIMLIKNNYSECRQYAIQIKELKIQKIYGNKWMIFSKNTQIITEHCRDETHKYNVKGTYLFTPSNDCDVQVADVYISKPTNASNISIQSTLVQVSELQRDIRKEANN
ncbi:hypothetical protein evm_015210 [Chilo suppressalis]|nr:hypothetical protein evm_015210 [Chilo suppressalis]